MDLNKESLRYSILAKQSEMIDLIDQEIINSQVKLHLLRLQLAEYESKKRIEKLNAQNNNIFNNKKEDKNIQVSFPVDISVQVDQTELKQLFVNQNVSTKNDEIDHKFNDQMINVDDNCQTSSDKDKHVMNNKVILVMPNNVQTTKPHRPKDPITKSKPTYSIQPNPIVNREKLYMEKVNKLKHRQSEKHVEHKEEITINKEINNQLIQCEDSNQIKSYKRMNQPTTKIFRHVAVETSFTDVIDEDEFNNLSFADRTVYMKLPERNFNKNFKNMNHPNQSTKELDVNELQRKLEDILNVSSDCTDQEVEQDECDVSLPTVKARESPISDEKYSSAVAANDDEDEVDCMRNGDSFSTTLFSSCTSTPIKQNNETTDISLPSIELTNLSDLSSINITKLDHELFWKDVLTKAGLKINKQH